jgi:hypothetical protein
MAVPNMIVTLVADATKFTSGLSQASGRLNRFGNVARNVAGMVAGAAFAMAAAFARFAVEAIKDASSLEQALGGVESVYKQFSGQMIAQSELAAEKVGLSMEAYQRLGVMTGTLLKNAGIPMKQLAKQTDVMITLAADLAATFGGTVEEAATAMNAALRGEFEPIRRFGIALSQAQIQEEALMMTQKGSVTELTKRDKILATQNLLLQQGADASGQFARESDTLANRQQVLNAKWENLSATMGEKLLPIAEVLSEALIKLVDSPGFQKNLARMVSGFEEFGVWLNSPDGTQAVDDLAEALKFVAEFLGNIVKGLKTVIGWYKKAMNAASDFAKTGAGGLGGGGFIGPGNNGGYGKDDPTGLGGLGGNKPEKSLPAPIINFNAPIDSVSAGREVARVLADYNRSNGGRR